MTFTRAQTAAALALLSIAVVSVDAHAAISGTQLLDNVLERYATQAKAWAAVITQAATWLFWMLATVSMVWTFAMLLFRQADIAAFFGEFVRFTCFTGFFYWLLLNGPQHATSIYASMSQLAGNAAGFTGGLSPSGVVDVGFAIYTQVLRASSGWNPIDSLVGTLMASVILMMLALIGVNMLLLLISGWVLAYAGIFFLGMGGSRWTSDMAINYYKTVLGIGAQLMSMVLLVGIGKTFLDDYWKSMSAGINYSELGVMMIVSLILLVLTNKVPSMIAGVITGASVGNTGVGSFGAGAAIGAAGVAATVASAGGAALMAGAANMAGVGSAIKAASAAANAMSQGGGGSFGGSSFGGGGDSGGSGGVGSALASAMGSSDSAGGAGATSSASASEGASFNPGGDGGGGGQAEASQGGTASSGGESGGAASSGGESGGSAAPAQAAEGAGSAQAAGKSWKNSAIANLARGTRDVLADKASDMKARAAERIAETPGGKVATAIRESTAASFGDDSLSAAPSAPSMDEVHAFSTKKPT